ncbi:tRNA-intron lyase [Candidatus Woesearchaeota archaeon]|nr:tRNA-intron lyase [Candidatus Woesearchaeota archaeon]
MIEGKLEREGVLLEDRSLYDRSVWGTPVRKGKITLSFYEACYLVEKSKILVLDGRKQEVDLERLTKKAKHLDKQFWTKYLAFKDLRKRGYIVKTALKFGADFRVYDKGIKPGKDHAKWVVYAVHEKQALTWHEFSAKNRVAHSTRKKLLLAVVDDEEDVTYWEVGWTRP